MIRVYPPSIQAKWCYHICPLYQTCLHLKSHPRPSRPLMSLTGTTCQLLDALASNASALIASAGFIRKKIRSYLLRQGQKPESTTTPSKLTRSLFKTSSRSNPLSLKLNSSKGQLSEVISTGTTSSCGEHASEDLVLTIRLDSRR